MDDSMFVRWIRKRRKRGPILGRGRLGELRWSAVLLTGHRVHAGNGQFRVRQEFLGFLAAISESELRIPSARRAFWTKAMQKLDALGRRIGTERGKLEARLAEVVKRPRLSRPLPPISRATGHG